MSKHVEEKWCPGCDKVKPIIPDFGTIPSTGKPYSRCHDCRLEAKRQDYAKYKEKRRAAQKKWQEANPNYHSDYNKNWHAENREAINERHRKRYQEDKERVAEVHRQYRENNKEFCAQILRNYDKTPAGKMSRTNRNHRRRERMGNGTIELADWEKMMDFFDGCCAYCGCELTFEDKHDLTHRTMDHIVPLSKGGKHDIDNVVPVCMSCNCKKHDRSFVEFLYHHNTLGLIIYSNMLSDLANIGDL